jgi:hypothetical protein
MYATSSQIEQLLSWSANPNYLDPDEGTALHRAILSNNLDAVKALLAHGANPLTPFTDGRLPSELRDDPADTKRSEILAIVRKAAGGGTSLAGAVGAPFKVGYEYQVTTSTDGVVDSRSWGDSFKAGDEFVFAYDCRFTDSAVACFAFKKLLNEGRIYMFAIEKEHLTSWTEWFKEIGPAPEVHADH